MWHDGDGWHIRATHRTTNKRTFAGQLSTGGTFAKVHAVHLEKSDSLQVSNGGHNITFLFKNYGHIDGVDFRTHCAPSISFAFQSDGKPAPAEQDRDRSRRCASGERSVHDLPVVAPDDRKRPAAGS